MMKKKTTKTNKIFFVMENIDFKIDNINSLYLISVDNKLV